MAGGETTSVMHPPCYQEIIDMQLTFDMKRCSKHVALIFHKNKLLITATNGWGEHAEEVAIEKLRHLPVHRRMRMYVTRIGMNRHSRPCIDCCSVLSRHPHIRVYYSSSDGTWIEETTFDSHHHALRRSDYFNARHTKTPRPSQYPSP